ncbi:uncharacterized protein LOC129000540 [Macrosteles quadrilineatus]|uniref:uncharacterized protein LOC129000540 n=1 Tax=Macrosteles quadrilineatus TaxID=74068 RepID=UPI0023E18FB3|nr:uncharacterized protein LOC129000540 [Macrosteles quadrilineatus]
MTAYNTLSLVVVGLLSVIGMVDLFGSKVGPYDLEIERLADCKDQGSRQIIIGTKITKAGRGKYLYKEKFSFLVPVDDDFKEYVEVQKWGNGGWRPKYMEVTLKNCDEIFNVLKDMYKNLMRSAGVSLEKCPIPMGNYTAKDFIIELNIEKTVPVMEYGKYRALMNLIYKDEKVGCMMFYVEVVPKSLGSLFPKGDVISNVSLKPFIFSLSSNIFY